MPDYAKNLAKASNPEFYEEKRCKFKP